MKINLKKIVILTVMTLGLTLLFAFVLGFVFPPAQSRWDVADDSVRQANAATSVKYTAVGDSLTEGVGDLTEQGGFVYLLSNDLMDYYGFQSVDSANYGVAGERSDQINKRLAADEELQQSLAEADFITITVGGNDLMRVFQNNFFDLSVDAFEKPIKNYQEQLEEMFRLVREQNSEAPIYMLGIYNPYYLSFSEIEELQTIFDNWNDATQETVEQQENAFFVPINDLLYQGLDGDIGVTGETEDLFDSNLSSSSSSSYDNRSDSSSDSSSSSSSSSARGRGRSRSSSSTSSSTSSSSSSDSSSITGISNDALYDGDSFHPNNLGYQLMANAVRDQMIDTQELWLPEGGVTHATTEE